MNVLALVGSPRKGGNTDILVDAVLAGATREGHEVRKIHLRDFAVGPCVDCRGCKRGALACVVEDGMQEIYPLLDAADAIVFGTPIYWCGPSGLLKNAFDRLRPYFANERLRGKRALVVTVAAEGAAEADLTVEMFRRSFSFLGMDFAGCVMGKGYDRGDVARDERALAEAALLGDGLGAS